MIRKLTYAGLGLALIAGASACHGIQVGTDIARQPNGVGGYSASIRDREAPGDMSNQLQGRERIWNDITQNCPAGSTGTVGAGQASLPSDACVTIFINGIQTGDGDPNESWVCVDRACETKDMPFTLWYRSHFTNTAAGRVQARDLIISARDFNSTITDPSLPPNQATGLPGCISVTDSPQLDMDGRHVTLRRFCF